MVRTPRLAAFAALLPIAAARGEEAHVRYVTDGDTFRLTSGERIRIAGIDAPETHAGQAKCRAELALGEAAATRARAMLDGRDLPDCWSRGEERGGGRAVRQSPTGVAAEEPLVVRS